MKKFAVTLLTLVGVALVGMTVASASQLTVNVHSVASMTEAVCSTAEISVTGVGHVSGNTWSQVELANIPAECAGEQLTYVLYEPNGAILRDGSATGETGTVSVTASSPFNAGHIEGARVLLGSWPGNSTWTAPTAVTPPFADNCVVYSQLAGVSGPCTITIMAVGPIEYSGTGEFQEVQVLVEHSVPQPMYWIADMNFAETVGLLVEPTRLGADWINMTVVNGCADFPVVRIRSADYQFNPEFYLGEFPTWRVEVCG